ncbi:unnamed protein product, partial [Brenthis ino]
MVCDSDDETREKLRKCVRRHQELIALVDQMEVLYSKSNLVNILSSSLLICLSGFNITLLGSSNSAFAFIPFLVVSLTQISLMCFFGDMLMASSTKIGGAIYNCRWYDTTPDIKKSVIFIMLRSKKPCKITAANFAVMNLTAFTTILSRSWSYFALLRTMLIGKSTPCREVSSGCRRGVVGVSSECRRGVRVSDCWRTGGSEGRGVVGWAERSDGRWATARSTAALRVTALRTTTQRSTQRSGCPNPSGASVNRSYSYSF